MTFAANYKSVVAIGGFNPSILTPEFLQECCGFHFEQEPEGRTTPVLTKIKFGNLQFMMELNKFQILLQLIHDFSEEAPVDSMVKYLKVLQYTPVVLLGVNLNYSLSGINLARLTEMLSDPFNIHKSLPMTPTSVSLEARKPDGGGLKLASLTVASQLDSRVKNTLKIDFEVDNVTINNNFEVGELLKDRSSMELLVARHADFVGRNQSLMEKLGEL